MPFTLGLNTNAMVNRYVEPEDLVATIADEIGMRRIQLTPEILSPDWPGAIVADHVRRLNRACERHGARITFTFTGNYSRLNAMAHPDPAVRRHYLGWFKRFVDITADLGAASTGSQIGILTTRDDADPQRRAERLAQCMDLWRELALHAKERGLKYLMWEPMSVRRELGHTIADTLRLQEEINRDMPIPILINADIDHGDVTSPNPDDTDPYAWARALARFSPVVHIKQSSMNKGGHWPFTAQHNRDGRITPEPLLKALREGGGTDNELVFEFTFREREPTDSSVVPALRESVEFWRGHVEI